MALVKRIVGTAGHIDHGKTALVRALTGIDCDRLPEEKRRGITIDLGFASLVAGGYQIGFVDVPGHERFVRNMLAGVGGIDSVILVVAADESIMPQTREHLAICQLLGIREGVVAVTKRDLVDPEMLELVRLEVADLVAGTFLVGKPIVAVSSATGEGLSELHDAILASTAAVPGRTGAGAPLRLPIDRAFTMKGFGTVVTGTVVSGEVHADDALELLPPRRGSRARRIEVHGEERAFATAGERTSINLSDIALDEVRRGQQLVTPGSLLPSQIVTVDLEVLPGERPLANQTRIRFHHFSTELLGTVRLLGMQESLEPGQRSAAQIRLESPVVALAGDRFVIRRYSPSVTIGGGVVLDPHLPKLTRGSRAELFETLRSGSLAERISQIARLNGLSGITVEQLRQRIPESREQIIEAIQRAGEQLVAMGERRWIHLNALQQLRRKAMTFLTEFFRSRTLAMGVPKSELIQKLIPPNVDARLSELLLADLEREKIIRIEGDLVDVPGRSKELGGAEGELARLIERRFLDAGLKAPPISELINTIHQKPKVIDGVVGYLAKREVLIRIADGVYLHRDVIASAAKRMKEHSGETVDIGWFKELFDLSRKIAIPLLEYFDRVGITKRVGDRRQIL